MVCGQESCKTVSLLKAFLHVIPVFGISIYLYTKITLAASHDQAAFTYDYVGHL